MPEQQPSAEPPTGRALDVAVAERVLGLRVVALDWPCGYSPDCGQYEASLDRELDTVGQTPDAVYCPAGGRWPPERMELAEDDWVEVADVLPVPCCSTEIGAAWAVVEALQARGWHVRLDTVAAGTAAAGWVVTVRQPAPARLLGLALARTCPEALCRAALAAVDTAGGIAQTQTQEASV